MATTSNPADYPPVGFFYTVKLASGNSAADARFKEISGLSVELGVKEIAEGGENRFKHRVPEGAHYPNLVLKRGLVLQELPFYQWCKKTIQGNLGAVLSLRSVQVVLLDDQGNPLKTWNVANAYPIKWNVSDFNSMDGQVVIESLEMVYQYFEVS